MRLDIQALRAVAVLSVLSFHLWPQAVTGGFIGVDVFFVISGFLITGHLVRDFVAQGKISLRKFYARRAVRLLPTALIVLAVAWVVTYFYSSKIEWNAWFPQFASSAFYVENWHLAANAVDYLALGDAPSPTQHFWTLSVEEQFYIALPLLLIVMGASAKALKKSPKPFFAGALILVILGTFGYSIWVTQESASLAYFSTFSRMWEFALGSLLSLALQKKQRFALGISLAGYALIAASLFGFTTKTPFPGFWAVVPVVGAMLVLYANPSKPGFINKALAPIGNISYAIYLWHWPAIVLLPEILGTKLTDINKIEIVAFSIAAAWVSTYMIENRIRFARKLEFIRRPWVVASWATVLMVAISATSLWLPIHQATLDAAARKKAQIAAHTVGNCLGAGSLDPKNQPCDFPELKTLLLPSTHDVHGDDSNLGSCWSRRDNQKVNICTLGPETGYTKHFFVVGDSHSNVLLASYIPLATKNHWRIEVAGRASCYWTKATSIQETKATAKACTYWNKAVTKAINSYKDLDAIIVMHRSTDEIKVAKGKSTLKAVVNGLVGAWESRKDKTVPILAILDNPTITPEQYDCEVKFGLEASPKCDINKSEALPDDGQLQAAAKSTNVRIVDLTKYYCPTNVCPMMIGNVLVYRDIGSHLTKTYAKTLTPYLEKEIVAALGLPAN
jgi:peptidoglycan/LPS O-acetylase OafA/YrhL